MTVFHIILVVFLVIWLIHYVMWGMRVARAYHQLKRTIEELHPDMPGHEFPPYVISFP
jgi:hypothetical protein